MGSILFIPAALLGMLSSIVVPTLASTAGVGRGRHTGDMAESISLAAVVPPLQSLVRHAARNRERITITDQGEPAAVVISADELEDLEDTLAVAEARLREDSADSRRIPHAEVRRRLGLEE